MGEKMMFIRHDKNPPFIIEDRNKRPVEMYKTPEGLGVYISDDIELVGPLITDSSEKYRLFRSKSFKVKVLQPNGSSRFVDVESWNYRVCTRSTKKVDEHNEVIYESYLEWYKHGPNEIMEPTELNITGIKKSGEPEVYQRLQEKNVKIAELERTVAGLTIVNTELAENVAALMKRIDQMEQIEQPEQPERDMDPNPPDGPIGDAPIVPVPIVPVPIVPIPIVPVPVVPAPVVPAPVVSASVVSASVVPLRRGPKPRTK